MVHENMTYDEIQNLSIDFINNIMRSKGVRSEMVLNITTDDLAASLENGTEEEYEKVTQMLIMERIDTRYRKINKSSPNIPLRTDMAACLFRWYYVVFSDIEKELMAKTIKTEKLASKYNAHHYISSWNAGIHWRGELKVILDGKIRVHTACQDSRDKIIKELMVFYDKYPPHLLLPRQ